MISIHCFCNHSLYCFHVEFVDSLKCPSNLVSGYHSVILQWISTKCQRLIHWKVYTHYLHNLLLNFIHIEIVNSYRWLSDLLHTRSCSTDFLPNAGLWLVKSYLSLTSTNTYCISSILELGNHLSDSQTWLAYHPTPVIYCHMLPSEWLRGFWLITPFSMTLFHNQNGMLLHYMCVTYWNISWRVPVLELQVHTLEDISASNGWKTHAL